MIKFLGQNIGIVFALSCSFNASCATPNLWMWLENRHEMVLSPEQQEKSGLLVWPNEAGAEPLIQEMNKAQHSLRLVNYHITDTTVAKALADIHRRGVRVSVLVDRQDDLKRTSEEANRIFSEARVPFYLSSPKFAITHIKAFVVDEKRAWITTLNFNGGYPRRRDWALRVTDPAVISEMVRVFDADIENAKNGTGTTPKLEVPNLLWSPINSQERLVGFIDSARHRIDSTVENLQSQAIVNALANSAKRGVEVRIIVPLCDSTSDPFFNLPAANELNRGAAHARVMPPPATAFRPYMHAKMMIVDGKRAYLGSENFTDHSLLLSRELGIITDNSYAMEILERAFEQDWSVSEPPPVAPSVGLCRKG